MTKKILGTGLLVLAMGGLLIGCEEQGPLERAGEEIDEAFEDARHGGETLGNQIDDAIDDARDELNEAGQRLRGE